MLRRRLRLRGKRRKAMALRHLDSDAGPRKLAALGVAVDPDLLYRSLPYAIDPEWTRGHRFTVAFEVLGEGGGDWVVEVDDGEVSVHSGLRQTASAPPDATIRLSLDTWMALLRGEVTPTKAMQTGLTRAEGALHPVTLLGRWADRAEGVDGPELEREERQRAVQASRIGSWGSSSNGAARARSTPPRAGRRRSATTCSATSSSTRCGRSATGAPTSSTSRSTASSGWRPRPRPRRDTAWTLSSFYVGEERVAADLAPFVLAAPSGEAEAFLATQLVDETRHAVFFDRWASEVMALSADDMRSRLRGGRGDDDRPLALPLRRLAARRRPAADAERPTTSSCSSRGS